MNENILPRAETDADIDLSILTYSMVRAIQSSWRLSGFEAKELLIKAIKDPRNNTLEIFSELYHLK